MIYITTVTIAMALIAAATFVAVMHIRGRERERLYDLVKHGVDRDQPLSADAIRQLAEPLPPSTARDVRRGLIMLFSAIGLGAGAALTIGLNWPDDDMIENLSPALVLAAVLGFVGVAYLLLGARRKD